MLTNVFIGQVRPSTNDPAPAKADDGFARRQGKSFSDHLDGQKDMRKNEIPSKESKVSSARNADQKSSEVTSNDSKPVASNRTARSQHAEGAEASANAPAESDSVSPDQVEADAAEEGGEGEVIEASGKTEIAKETFDAAPVQPVETKRIEDRTRATEVMQPTSGKGEAVANAAEKGSALISTWPQESDASVVGTNAGNLGKGEAVGPTAPAAPVSGASETETTHAQPDKVGKTGVASGDAQGKAGLVQTVVAQNSAAVAGTANAIEPNAGDQTGGGAALSQQATEATQKVSAEAAKTTVGSVQTAGRAKDTTASAEVPINQSQDAESDGEIQDVKVASDVNRAQTAAANAAATGQTGVTAQNTSEPGRRAQARASEAKEAARGTSATSGSVATASNSAAQVSAVQQAFVAQVQALGAEQATTGGQAESSLMGGEHVDMPGLSQLLTEAVLQPGTVHRPETPRLVAVQLAEAFAAKGERNVDVALNPEELGRVKMRVSTSENGIAVLIQTERPETGDLMRRHISELAEEFRKMGFENISFEFSGGGASSNHSESEGGGQPGSGKTSPENSGEMAAAPVAETAVQHLRFGNSGVDMRV